MFCASVRAEKVRSGVVRPPSGGLRPREPRAASATRPHGPTSKTLLRWLLPQNLMEEFKFILFSRKTRESTQQKSSELLVGQPYTVCAVVWTLPACVCTLRTRPAGCTGCRPGVDRLVAPCRRTSIVNAMGLLHLTASFWRSEHACQRPTGGFSSSRHARQSCRCGFEAWGASLDGLRRGRDNRRANAITSLRSVCPAGSMPALTARVLCLGRATRQMTPRPSSEKTTPRHLDRSTAEPDRPSKTSRP